jgi:hypothetical protein
MRRLIIIVEGDTEKEFIEKTLRPYLASEGVFNLSCYKIRKTNGGLTNYDNLKDDLVSAIYEDNVLVTTLIDYYALPKNFPKYAEAQRERNKSTRLAFLEQAIVEDIKADGYLPQLHPYIQLHEFEAFLFTDIEGFELNFAASEANLPGIRRVIGSFPNPEDINDSPVTAPSKRLEELIPAYRKIVFGNIVIEANGIERILESCPRFKSWTDEIVRKTLL